MRIERPRDVAKLDELVAGKGHWNGKQFAIGRFLSVHLLSTPQAPVKR
jgi:hypothetical protein